MFRLIFSRKTEARTARCWPDRRSAGADVGGSRRRPPSRRNSDRFGSSDLSVSKNFNDKVDYFTWTVYVYKINILDQHYDVKISIFS